ncbi:MAG TPA: hypothetical protein VN132_14350 [Bdellovibrio sp.]|nr:hypothetical protein [Bdellovibrio sp.]
MSIKISRILHAGYVLQCDQTQIAFDPIFENPFSRNCDAFPNVQFDYEKIRGLQFSAVFISHFHDDHCSLESLNLLDRKTPIYLFCIFEELFSMIKELGFTNVHSLELNKTVKVGPFEVTPWPALDVDVDSLFQIKARGFNILNVVDSWIDYSTLDELIKQGPWDMIMWPFQTMRELEVISPTRAEAPSRILPEEWIGQLRDLNPRYVIPSSCQLIFESWSWYNQAFFPISYKQFQKEIETEVSNAEVVRLNPGVSVVLSKDTLEPSLSLDWIQPLGEQNVDYSYDSDLQPPPTSEISKHFAALTEEQLETVLEYCRNGLVQKYKTIGSSSAYFEKRRFWKLSVYDHQGKATQFLYEVYKENIERSLQQDAKVSWSTEVPIAKLYAALELGESLTSMYMRINEMSFDEDTEKELEGVDLGEDPLIRCLFNGAICSYQAFQLKQIKGQR